MKERYVIEFYNHTKKDFDDALDILNWNPENASLVSGSQSKERMNEYKTHGNWAMRTKLLAEAFGLKD